MSKIKVVVYTSDQGNLRSDIYCPGGKRTVGGDRSRLSAAQLESYCGGTSTFSLPTDDIDLLDQAPDADINNSSSKKPSGGVKTPPD